MALNIRAIIWFVPFRWAFSKSTTGAYSNRCCPETKSIASMRWDLERLTKSMSNLRNHFGNEIGKVCHFCGQPNSWKKFTATLWIANGWKTRSAFIRLLISRTFCADGFRAKRHEQWNESVRMILRMALNEFCECFWQTGKVPKWRTSFGKWSDRNDLNLFLIDEFIRIVFGWKWIGVKWTYEPM